MSMPTQSSEVSGQITASNSNGEVTVLMTEWMPAFGTTYLRVIDTLRGENGNLAQQVQVRFAEVLPDLPGAWALAPGSARTADGGGVQELDYSGGTAAPTKNLWMQVGLAAQVASGTGTAEGFSTLRTIADTQGKLVGRRTVDLQPVTNSGGKQYIELCEPLPALGFSSFMFGVVAYGLTGTPKLNIAYRTVTWDVRAPSAWTDLLGTDESPSGSPWVWNSEVQAIAPATLGTVAYVQPGLMLEGTGASGRFEAIVAAKW